MPKGYWIAHVTVTDKDTYDKYIAGSKKAFEKYAARFLVRGGRHEAPDGGGQDRNVLIEFESFDQAVACYHSPEYQEALKFRKAASTGETILVEGLE